MIINLIVGCHPRRAIVHFEWLYGDIYFATFLHDGSGKLVRTIEYGFSLPTSLAFSPDGKHCGLMGYEQWYTAAYSHRVTKDKFDDLCTPR